eukprot:4220600-Amphidinium_carterae.1
MGLGLGIHSLGPKFGGDLLGELLMRVQTRLEVPTAAAYALEQVNNDVEANNAFACKSTPECRNPGSKTKIIKKNNFTLRKVYRQEREML